MLEAKFDGDPFIGFNTHFMLCLDHHWKTLSIKIEILGWNSTIKLTLWSRSDNQHKNNFHYLQRYVHTEFAPQFIRLLNYPPEAVGIYQMIHSNLRVVPSKKTQTALVTLTQSLP